MATEDASRELAGSEINGVLSSMKDANKAKRRKALEKYESIVFENGEGTEQEELTEIFNYSASILGTCLSDPSEINRINASNIILKYIELSVFTEEKLLVIIPVIHHRLATVPCPEESEDVRLLYINILTGLISMFQAKMIAFMNDIVNILKEAVLDPSPEVRKAACECVCCYARATKDKFHMQSESLVKPLVKALHHQRFKNRIACIKALGDILLYGESRSIQDLSGPLAQCMMDIPQVRLVVVTVGGSLAMEMPDRYSYWQRIFPLLLSGLRDEDKDVKNKAESLWEDVGKKYEKENEEQLKEQIDFDAVPEHYPPTEKRPGVGCRSLVQKSLYHMLPGLLTDMDDWQAGPRLQAAKLLTTLVVNAESGITQYVEKILEGLVLASSDKEADVVKQVVECSEYLGYFVPPATYLPLILPRLGGGQYGERPLIVLSALARGTPAALLQESIAEIVEALANEDISHVTSQGHQSALLQVIHVLIEKCDPRDCSYSFFSVLLYIASTSEEQDTVSFAQEQLETLANKSGFDRVCTLYDLHLSAVLNTIHTTASSWNEQTPHFMIFLGLLELADQSLGRHLERVVGILCDCVPKKQDPFVSLKCLMKLHHLLKQEEHPLNSNGELERFLPVIVSDILKPFLPWHAGSTAAALRTAAVSCLVSVCQVGVASQKVSDEVKICLALIPALIEDDSEDTRHLSCEVVMNVVSSFPQLIDSETLHTLANKLVKRFDDVSAVVRLKSARVLAALFKHLPENYNPSIQTARLRDLYESATVFLDDPDEILQGAVSDALEEMGKISPEILKEVLEKDRPKFRNKHVCEKLIASMNNLQIAVVN
ncbi:dynein axonemal assembly factor 5-like [Penaeus chinensis]|uniref:dynein axonemal assembly factor 5-like n=1 Tax=Penaeus chinensis TaxID=139456 RepID=UPI001FB65991|nr:dynein axonemal assembly factor 5-like [Penaeus chinensis]